MENDLTTIDPADGRLAQARRALNLLPSTTDRLAQMLGEQAPLCIEAAIAKTEHELRPVPSDTVGRKQWEMAIDERLRRLAAKVLPTAGPAQTADWRDALAEALADLPAMISLTAAKRAIHRPFRFIGDIEAAVREIATEVLSDRQMRLSALRRHRDEIDRALNPATPALPPAEEDREFTSGEIRAMTADIRAMGLRAGFISQAQIDAAIAGDHQLAA
jgi:hypothetical protein